MALFAWTLLQSVWRLSDKGGMANIGLILDDFKNVKMDNYDKVKICSKKQIAQEFV